jgi:radical SAM superfamily enzyme YgiQ (UPF0313 family)
MIMARIALVRLGQNTGNMDLANEDIGIGYLASSLRNNGIETQIFDNSVCSNEEMRNKLVSFSPDIVGYTSSFLTIDDVLKFDKSVQYKTRPFKCHGGLHATFSAKDLLMHEDVDAIVMGEGEKTLPELVYCVEDGISLQQVKGIAYLHDGQVYFTERREATDLDSIPTPARDILKAKLDKGGKKITRIVSSRGCLHGCNYCITPSVRNVNPGPIYRERDPIAVVDEMEELHNNYGIEIFYFNDDLFFSSRKPETKERPLKIAQEIMKRDLDIKYKVELRADSVDPDKDREFMETLKQSGLYRVFVGVESGSDAMLRFIGKGINNETNRKFVRFMESMGIKVDLGEILFGPFTKWEELQESVEFFNEMGYCGHILRRAGTKLESFPGTKLTHQLEEKNLLENKPPYRYRTYEFENPVIGEFTRALEETASLRLPRLRDHFENRIDEKSTLEDEKRINEICYNFLIENIKMKNNWSREIFNYYMNLFMEDLRCQN